MLVRFRRRTVTAPGGQTWRDVPLTAYEVELLDRVAAERGNVGTWRETLLRQIVERFRRDQGGGVLL